MSASQRLDTDELLNLAVAASRQERHADAIDHLKHAIELAPENAKAVYMLGAEHAQIGMYDRAIGEMHRAVELDSNLHAARFQLGLLLLTQARVAEAIDAWRALDALGERNALYQFKTGLEHLVRDDFAACRLHLERGIGINDSNPALNADMRRVLQEIAQPEGAPPPEPGSAESSAEHVFLSVYSRSTH